MKLRKAVVFMLVVAVAAPILLYTNILDSYSTSPHSRNEFIEQVSSFTYGGDIRPWNVLPHELSSVVKEPLGIVYSENLNHSTLNFSDTVGDASTHSTENGLRARKLTEESVLDQQDTNSSSMEGGDADDQSADENPIRQVTETAHEANNTDGSHKKHVPVVGSYVPVGSLSVKEEPDATRRVSSHKHVTDKASKKMETNHGQHLLGASDGEGAIISARTRTKKQTEQTVMVDAQIRQLKDQLIRGRVYLSLSATRNNAHFIRELRLRMKEVQRTLGIATKDSELPRNANERSNAMEQTLAKGKQIQDDCAAIAKKLRAMLHSTEDQLRVHRKQALFLTHLTAKTLPKGLHCLPLRLSVQYFALNSSQRQFPNQDKLEDPRLYHYALFSDNVLAAAVVVNSSVSHVKDSSNHVFHIVTDRLNSAAMRMWFLANPPGNATVEVQNVEEFSWLNSSYSPVLKQLGSATMKDYYFKSRHAESDSNSKFRNLKYLSIMNHLRFYLPEIFPKLDKVLFLDDDVVVQKELTSLWSVDLKGKVIGVVETCGERFHRFDCYLNFSNPLISKNFDPRACGWAFGMNIFDLKDWRRQNITNVYHSWQNLNNKRLLWKLGTLPPGLITFWNRTYALDRSWHVLGLGYNPNVSQKDIVRAAVVHYNGNLKPWLEISIPKFRDYWTKYVDYDIVYLHECNINP